MPVLALVLTTGILALVTPAELLLRAQHSRLSGSRVSTTGWGRREALLSSGMLLLGGLSQPNPAEASYALYSAAQDSYVDRQKSGFVPVATNDRATLAAIQGDIERKRGSSYTSKKGKKAQYCAGQTSGVQPMLENICANIGISKADQSNTQVDSFGNMNIGVYNEQYKLKQLEAAEAARLRAKAATSR